MRPFSIESWELAKTLLPEYVAGFLACFPTDSENVWKARKFYLTKLRDYAIIIDKFNSTTFPHVAGKPK